MQQCPKCSSEQVRRSRSRTRWERWRKEITGKRTFRCDACGWRGWGVDEGPSFSDIERAMAERALVPEPPNLERAGLAREVAARRELQISELDAGLAASDDNSKPD